MSRFFLRIVASIAISTTGKIVTPLVISAMGILAATRVSSLITAGLFLAVMAILVIMLVASFALIGNLGGEVASLNLCAPNDGNSIGSSFPRIEGQVILATKSTNVGLALKNRNLVVVPFVQPLGSVWYAQDPRDTDRDGKITGNVRCGTAYHGRGEKFKIGLLITRQGLIESDEEFDRFPSDLGTHTSNFVTIRRDP